MISFHVTSFWNRDVVSLLSQQRRVEKVYDIPMREVLFITPHKKAIKMKNFHEIFLMIFFLFFFLFQELAISSTEKRNWRGICIALLVISAVLSIIVFSIFLLSPGKSRKKKKKKNYFCYRSHASYTFFLASFFIHHILIKIYIPFPFFAIFSLFSSWWLCAIAKKINLTHHVRMKYDISNRGR